MFPCQPNNMSRIRVNVLYLIWFLNLLFLFNLVLFFKKLRNFAPFQIEIKFNFYVNVIMMFLFKFTFLLNICCFELQLV